MEIGAITSYIDVAQLTLYAFWIFFAGLIWHLRKEDWREGYPIENDLTGEYVKDSWLYRPNPKVFRLPHGRGERSVPDDKRDDRPLPAERTARFAGAPLRPTGDPMASGMGPGSWAERADHPDLMRDGTPTMAPMRVASEFSIAEGDKDPRGMPVVGCDGKVAGEVSEIWVDRAEQMIRYLEVKTGARTVLLPINFARFPGVGLLAPAPQKIRVHAITAAQFDGVPGLANPDQITLLEEERIVAYFGGGKLYATPERSEPLL